MTVNTSSGSGPEARPVVLLHSIGLSASAWNGVARALADRPVLRPESRGHGSRAWDGEPITLAAWVEDLREHLDSHPATADGHPVDLVGLSMGGVQALAFAAMFPDRVHRLVVADSFAALPPATVTQRIETMGAAVAELGMAGFAEHYLATTLMTEVDRAWRQELAGTMAAIAPAAFLASVQACFTADLRDRLADIRSETLVLVGALDQKTPRHLSEEIADGIGGARLAEIPDAGHLSCVDAPEAFADTVTAFLTPTSRPVAS